MTRVLEAARSAPWLMMPERVEELLSIAARENEVTPETLEAYRARSVSSAERLTRRDETAVIPVVGPLFRRANLFTEMSGATSYAMLRRDFQAAMDDPSFTSIILDIDSPGGEANGTAELAEAIFQARDTKRVVAYVGGTAASAAYWIASAASEIVISPSALLGSIGVALTVRDTKALDEKRGVRSVEFVSSQSPGKRPDPSTDDGRDRLQRMVDDLAEVFIDAVARHRGVSAEDVVSRFGQGGFETGAKAVAAGMADRVGNFEALITELNSAQGGRRTTVQIKGSNMDNANGTAAAENAGFTQADIDNARAEGRAEGEKAGASAFADRISAIVGAEGIRGNAARLSAALDLSVESPGMSADKVVAFVTTNVPAEAKDTPSNNRAALSNREGVPDSLAAAATEGAAGRGNPSKVDAILADQRAVVGDAPKQR